MEKKTAIIVAVVCLVAVIGVAAYFLTSGDDPVDNTDPVDPDPVKPDTPAVELPEPMGLCYVYGNVNEDYTIDGTDVKLAEEMAKNPSKASEYLEKYRFADVNHDGKINSADVSLIKSIADGKAANVDVLDTGGNTVTVKYPMNNLFVVGGTNMRVIIEALDTFKHMSVVATNDSIGNVLDRNLISMIDSGKISTVTMKATSEDISDLSKMKIDTMIRENKRTNSYGEEVVTKFLKDKGIASLELDVDSYDECRMVASTVAFLTGETELGKKYVGYQEDVAKEIKDKLGPKFGTKTVMTVTISNSVSGTKSDYFAASEIAGGKNLADFPDKQKKFDPSKGEVWLLDPKYNPDYMFHFKSLNYGKEDPTQKDIDKYSGYFSETKAYQAGHYYLINGIVPLPVRIAFMAELMYPETFAAGWADGIFQEYIDDFTDVKDWKVSEHQTVWSVKDF